MTGEWWKVVSQRKFWILFPKVNFGSPRTFGNGCWTETMGIYYRAFLTWLPLPHKKQALVSVTGMCLRIIIRCHFRFILWLWQHCFLMLEYKTSLFRLSPIYSWDFPPWSFICAYQFKNNYFLSVYYVPRDATCWRCCRRQGREGHSSRGAFSLVLRFPHRAAMLVLAHHVMWPRLSDLPQAMVVPNTTLALPYFFIMLCHMEGWLSL